jgi:hypothetical protein
MKVRAHLDSMPAYAPRQRRRPQDTDRLIEALKEQA